MRRLARRFGDCMRGTAAIEFAIVSTLLIGLCVAAVDFGRTLFAQHQISSLADQAVRKVLIDPEIPTATLESELRDGFTAGDAADLTVDVTTETADGITYRVVTVGFPMTLFVPGLSSDAVALSVTRRVPAG
jgi:Flp pilus assembly protein TadG